MFLKFTLPALMFLAVSILPGGSRQSPVENISLHRVLVKVRVLDREGKPVRNLRREDFILHENGVEKIVENLIPMERRIGVHDISMIAGGQETATERRLFVLIFDIVQVSESLKKGMEFFFRRILKPGDDILLVVGDRSFFLDSTDGSPVHRKELLMQHLVQGARRSRQVLDRFSSTINQALSPYELDKLRDDTNFHFNPVVTEYVRHYYLIMDRYIRRFLFPRRDNYHRIARYLRQVPGDKWVIHLLGKERFLQSRAADRSIQRIRRYLEQQGMNEHTHGDRGDNIFVENIVGFLENIDELFQHPPDSLSRDLGKDFLNTRTTFFSVIMAGDEGEGSGPPGMENLVESLTDAYQRVTRFTGGESYPVDASGIAEALHRIAETTEQYYLLAYSPQDPGRRGKIRVSVNSPQYRLIYDDRDRKKEDTGPGDGRGREKRIRLKAVHLDGNRLDFAIEGFSEPPGGRTRGRLFLKVILKTPANEVVFSGEKTLVPRKDEVRVHLDLPQLEKRSYYLVIEARDLVSLKSDLVFLQTLQ